MGMPLIRIAPDTQAEIRVSETLILDPTLSFGRTRGILVCVQIFQDANLCGGLL